MYKVKLEENLFLGRYDHDLTGGGSPPPKIEKNKFVLKWFLGNFKCFKLMFFSKKKKKKLTENWSAADPTHPP